MNLYYYLYIYIYHKPTLDIYHYSDYLTQAHAFNIWKLLFSCKRTELHSIISVYCIMCFNYQRWKTKQNETRDRTGKQTFKLLGPGNKESQTAEKEPFTKLIRCQLIANRTLREPIHNPSRRTYHLSD